MGIEYSLEKWYNKKISKGWYKTYFAFDVHGTILLPKYNSDTEFEFYSHAKETLQIISKRPDIVMIIYTSSYPEQIKIYNKFFKKNKIFFDYFNENPEQIDNAYGYYKNKPYFDIYLEDKAGFNPEFDWLLLKVLITEKYTLESEPKKNKYQIFLNFEEQGVFEGINKNQAIEECFIKKWEGRFDLYDPRSRNEIKKKLNAIKLMDDGKTIDNISKDHGSHTDWLTLLLKDE